MNKAMFGWRKLGKVFDPADFPGRWWMKEFAQAPATLLMDDRLRVYFSCRPSPDAQNRYVSYSAFVDLDRRNPTRVIDLAPAPILSLGNTGEFDEFGTYPVSIISYGDDLRAYYAGWTRCVSVPFNTAIGVAISRDGGKSFIKEGPGPVLPYTPDEPFVMSGPKIRRFEGQWQLFYIAGRKWKVVDGRSEPVYKIRMATSEDGLSWRKCNRDLIESRIEEDEAQASPDVFRYGDKYHMFFCYRYSTNYRSRQYGYRIGYAFSHDLVTWVRDDARAGIDVSDQGWDSEMVSYPHVFEMDGRIYMAYLGDQVGKNGFGLAVLDGALY